MCHKTKRRGTNSRLTLLQSVMTESRTLNFKKHELWLRAGKKILKCGHNKILNNVTSYCKLCLIHIKNFSFKLISALDFSYANHLSSVGTGSYNNHKTSKNMPKGSTKIIFQPTKVVLLNIKLMSSD